MRSLRSTINIGFILISTITAIVIGGVSLILGIQYTENEAKEKLTLMVSAYSSEIEQSLGKIRSYSDVLESLINSIWNDNPTESEQIKKQKLAKFMLTYCKSAKPNSFWIVFNPKATNPPYALSLFDSTERGNYTFEPDYNILTIDTTIYDIAWWKNAQKDGETWTNPYYWKPWNKTIISYARKLTVKNQFIAVFGSDFFFNKLKVKIASAKSFNSGYFWIVDQNYQMILHPTLQNIKVRTIDSGNIIDKISEQKLREGNLTYEYQGKQKMLAFKRLSNNWTLCMSVPYSEIHKQQRTITIIIMGLMLLLSVLAILISTNLSRNITNPLTGFIAIFKKGAEGDLSVRTSTNSPTTEILALSENFNFFMARMQWQVTELEETKESLILAIRKEEEANRLKSAFLSNISHEIRTPLNAVIGFSELIKKEKLSEEEKNRFSNLVVKNAYALLRTLDDVIQASKIESGNLSATIEKTTVSNVLDSVIEVYTKHRGTYVISKETELIVENNSTNETAYILTDIMLLQEMLSQMLENSIKFTAEGTIKIGAIVSNSTVVFYVEDTGIGIALEKKEKIFDLFYKANHNQSQLFGGSGLGLTIAKGIADLLGASLWVESEPSIKTTFFVGLPRIY
ncbi:sensor histidine kinase [Williamwhitmania taraxaci]|uniref:histidine kinase n=1 Tax=Williamwhitmania taraxaci TaxID=1640674 RepID=A0A1G6HFE9_9BACT|nr:sensor histidine kinase [Williamwhitmania taraxaci]SDB92838.1 Signal transduction histidine kinase [Williamwhitmania taraxaci]